MVPHRGERVGGVVHIGSKIRAGKGTVNYFGSGGLEYMYASQSSPNEIMFCLGGELQQAVVYWCSLLIARSCMHDIYDMCVLGMAEDLEARVLKRKLRAAHRERRRVPLKTGNGARSYNGSGTVGVERTGSDGKPEAFSLFRARRSSRIALKLYQHVTTYVYQGNYCRVAVRV